MYLELLHYNNYYNRIAKYHETIGDYLADEDFSLVTEIANVNFNPNDGIVTEQIVNNLGDGSVIPDYAFVFDREAGRIVSRWFVIEATRTRSGQYKLTLYRDVIADWREQILSAPTFIEKATLSTANRLLYNSETMTYNQIKKSETLLKDATNTPWIVGYVANSLESQAISTAAANVVVNYPNYTSWDSYEFSQYTDENPYVGEYADFHYSFFFQDNSYNTRVIGSFDENNNPAKLLLPIDTALGAGQYLYKTKSVPKSGYWRKFLVTWADVGSTLKTWAQFVEPHDFKDMSYGYTRVSRLRPAIADEGGKIIQIGDKYYEIILTTKVSEPKLTPVSSDDPNTQYWRRCLDQMGDVLDLTNKTNTDPYCGFEYTTWDYVISRREIDISSVDFTIGADRTKLTDAPYAMFAMPADSLHFTVNGGVYTSNDFLTYRLVQNMITALGSNLYDIQLLPYCPLTDLQIVGGNLLIPGTENKDYVLIKDENDNVASVLLWANTSSFERELDYKISLPSSAIEIKVANECDRYRIVSPTYNGEFEFSAAKNGGVDGFMAYFTYKPFNPFIKVAPVFNSNYLYGGEFEDARGCICQGDFSLPQINDKWVEYQINNKNYLNAFNRQIENMDINNAQQQIKDIVNIATGTLQGAVSGGVAGFMAGGGYGAAAGAVVGGVASLGGGIADYFLNEQLRTEARDYAIDQFNYSLGNVKALPYSLANIGAQTIVSKLFPFVEYYTCTDTEKNALRDKIKYNGMTVGTIGTIEDYLLEDYTYIKGRLIRLEGVEDDFHVINIIADEINKGVFIKK